MCLRARETSWRVFASSICRMSAICVVGVIECFAQNICGTFCGREFLKQYKDRKFECFTPLRTDSRIATGVHRFGKPGPDVSFAARVGGLG